MSSKRTWLNRLLGKHGVLKKTDFRYKLIQLMGYALYGRKIGYLSWWQHASLSANIMLFHKGKLLIGRRRNMLDANGKYSGIGGFIEMERGETFEEGLAREAWEETGIRVDVSKLTEKYRLSTRMWYGDIYEQHGMAHAGVSYVYYLSDDEVATLCDTHEMHEFMFVDKNELLALVAQDEMAFAGEHNGMCKVFDEGRNTP